MVLFVSRRFLYFISLDKSDSLDDESENFGSDSGSSCTCYFCDFSLSFDESVVSVSFLGYGIFSPTGVESKGGRLLEFFWRSNSLFSLQISN